MDVYDINEDLVKELVKHKKIEECSKAFNKISEDYDKVNFVEELLRRFGEIPGIESRVDKHLSKNNDNSENFRKEGNHYFSLRNKNYFKAIELYNKSICFAPEGSENLGIGYANRSAIFLEWKKYNECLESIKIARHSNYPEQLLHKLYKRGTECLDNMSKSEGNEEIVENVEFELSHEKHPQVPFISKCLDIKQDEKNGRYIYTKEELVPGQLVSIEEPFCTVLLPPFRYIRCANCNIENNFNLIPCPNCTSAMFCSEKCMEEANKSFHKYECPVIDVLFQLFNKIHLTALRVTLLALNCFDNVEEFIKYCNAPENQNKDAFSIDYKNFNKMEHYRAIHGLVTNQEKRSTPDLFQRAVICAVLRYFMLKDTPLSEIFNTEGTKKFFTNLLFKHMQTSPSNMHSVDLIEQKNEEPDDQCFATAAYAFNSLLNHSCAPNVLRIHKNTKCYTFVLRPIPENGVLYENYGYHFAIQPRLFRQEKLKSQYNFVCECEACVNDYPLLRALKAAPGVPDPVTANDIEMLWSYDKKFAKENYKRYISFLHEYARHYYPCAQASSTEEALKMALNILMDAVPLKCKV